MRELKLRITTKDGTLIDGASIGRVRAFLSGIVFILRAFFDWRKP